MKVGKRKHTHLSSILCALNRSLHGVPPLFSLDTMPPGELSLRLLLSTGVEAAWLSPGI